ncbi:MAG: amino acid adenylation domain-containing protein, partial [bacterium]
MSRTARQPLQPSSLVDLLERRSEEQGERLAYTFLADGDREVGCLTFAELDVAARRVAAALNDRTGERALLLYPPGLEFIIAFFGCLRAGVVAVPAYPPRSRRSLPRLRAVVAEAEPAFLLTTSDLLPRMRRWADGEPWLARITTLATESDLPDPEEWRDPGVEADSVAFLQFTSGSTANPKGVRVTHRNLLHNEEMIRRAFGQSERSVIVSWLPLYHDMGLIGGVLQPLYVGARMFLMSPMAFLKRPLRWLAAIDRYRGTTSGAPNFAYDRCVDAVSDEDRERLDLSSWTVAFNGAEPVRSATLERFAKAFAPAGFSRRAFFPCYGLAEATLFVTGRRPEEAVRFLSVSASSLERGRPVPEEAAGSRHLVGCGRPWLSQRVVIADPDSHRLCPDGHVGEVWVRGSSVADGYWGRPDETAETFGARMATEPEEAPYLRTGDLGFLWDGELFVTGRLKDLIILRGRNLYPHDLEQTCERAHPMLRAGGAAAFSMDDGEVERLVVVQEVEPRRRRDREEQARAVEKIRQALAEEHDVAASEVLLVAAGQVPRTSSNKVRRAACREAYREGRLEVLTRDGVLADPDGWWEPRSTSEGIPDPARLAGMALGERAASVLDELRREVGRAARLSERAVRTDVPLISLGLDSIAAVELRLALESRWGLTLSAEQLLDGPTLQGLARCVAADLDGGEASAARHRVGEPPEEPESRYPLSHGQRALWFLKRLTSHPSALHLAGAARVVGELDTGAFECALKALVDRHPALRTRFFEEDGEPIQEVTDGDALDFAVLETDGDAEDLEHRLEIDARHPLKLAEGRPVRVRVFRSPNGLTTLLVVIHHLVADLWSLTLCLRELEVLYLREKGAATGPLPPAGDFSAEVRREWELLAAREEELWAYWRRRLAGTLPVLDLGSHGSRASSQGVASGRAARSLPRTLVPKLHRTARECETTLFTVLLVAYQVLLSRYTGTDDVIVGTPSVGREDPGSRQVVGYFVKPVPLRASLAGSPSGSELLVRSRKTVSDDLAHSAYPVSRIAERLVGERDPFRSPLYQTLFSFQRVPAGAPEGLVAMALGVEGAMLPFADVALESLTLTGDATFDLALEMGEVSGDLWAVLRHDTGVLEASAAKRLLKHLEMILEGLADTPEVPVAVLPLLDGAERQQVTREWNDSRVPITTMDNFAAPIFERAVQMPEAVAVSSAGSSVSFGEVARAADALAARLRGAGIGAGDRVGVLLEPSTDLVVVLLGVLRAGAAFVPLDPGYPPARLVLMCDDARLRRLVSTQALASRLELGVPLLYFDAPAADPPAAKDGAGSGRGRPRGGDIAYVIYTSGSTGRPKGVEVPHRAVANFLASMTRRPGLRSTDVLFSVTTPSFDIFVLEVFLPLVVGARVEIAPRSVVHDGRRLREALEVSGSTVFQATPVTWRLLLDSGWSDRKVRALCGGEALDRRLADRLLASAGEVWNLYGPTETTVWSAVERVYAADAPVCLGQPVANTAVYVLGRGLEPQPVSARGEIWIGGLGVARGYFRRGSLTAEHFVPDPFASCPGSRMYRTGDLGVRGAQGRLEFLGRADHQVKVRGFRIEPAEVEENLRALPGVREVVVGAWSGAGDRVLVTWLVPGPRGVPAPDAMREALREGLPQHMVPSRFVVLQALPRTPNGKVDRRRLPEPAEVESRGAATPPRTLHEELVTGLMADLLGVEALGVDEDFFAVGGHSLLAARLVSRIRERLGVELPLAEVFAAPTAAQLAARLERARTGGPPARPRLRRAPADGAEVPLTYAQRRLWFFEQLQPGSPAYNLPVEVAFRGRLSAAALTDAVAAIVRRHGVLRACFPDDRGVPRQAVAASGAQAVRRADLSGLSEEDRRREAERLAERLARRPFDLGRGPLFLAAIVRLTGNEHRLVVSAHHTVADGVSLEIFFSEARRLEAAFADGVPSPLPPIPLQYADYAISQRDSHWRERWDTAVEFWRRKLEGVPVLELPTDRPRPPLSRFAGGRARLPLAGTVVRNLRGLARRHGATRFMVFLAGFQVLLARLSSRTRFAVGAPFSQRDREELENLIGLFVNTLPIPLYLDGGAPFPEVLEKVRDATLEVYEHGDVPYELLAERLATDRSLDREPLFQVTLTAEVPLDPGSWRNLEVEAREIPTGSSKFDLSLFVGPESTGGTALALEFDSDLFDAVTAERWLRHLAVLLEAAATDPKRPVEALPLLSPAGRHQLLWSWSHGASSPECTAVHRRVEAQARIRPDAVAVTAAGRSLSYGQLHRRAAALARRLREGDVGPEVTVGVLAGRSLERIVAILAVLQAGGAYVPMDPVYPQGRLAAMAATARCRWLLAGPGESVGEIPVATRVLRLEETTEEVESGSALPAALADQRAYVVFTSGST